MTTKVDNLQVDPVVRKDALVRFGKQMAMWGLKPPAVEPLVMDFGQGQYEHIGLIEYWIANEIDAGYCGKYLFLFDAQQCPLHSHRDKHETFFVVKGRCTLTVNGQSQELTEGDVWPVPPGEVHTFTGAGNVLLLELSSPCHVDDNRFDDDRIAHWLQKKI